MSASVINQISRVLYRVNPILRNIRAAERALELGSADPIIRRVGRVYAGRIAKRLLAALIPPSRP